MTATEHVILVDDRDNEIGVAEKLLAHQQNLLHRAFSIFIFRHSEQGGQEILIQQRAFHKYHCGGLWSNTCCSHPRPHEGILSAGQRRLAEELGLEIDLENIGQFKYNVRFPNDLFEHEMDHVLIGDMPANQIPTINTNEIHAIRWIRVEQLIAQLEHQPDEFTPWLKQALNIAITR